MKKFLFLLPILLLLPDSVRPCYEDLSEETRFWLYLPEVADMRGLLPFTYIMEENYYPSTGEHETNENAYIQDKNITEWAELCGTSVQRADIQRLLYDTNPKDYFSGKIATNSFLSWLKKPENAAFKQYMDLAKKYEANFTPVDQWAGVDMKKIAPSVGQLAVDLEKIWSKTTDKTLKLRTAYLLMKCYRNLGEKAKTLAVFEKTLGKCREDSWLFGSIHYLNGAVQSDSAKRALMYARAWQYDTEAKTKIQRFFAYQSNLSFLDGIEKSQDKATILAIETMSAPSLSAEILEEIHELDENERSLSQLLAREVNKLENVLLASQVMPGFFHAYNAEYAKEQDLKLKNGIDQLHRLRAFVEKVCTEGKRKDLSFWILTQAHLAFLDQDFPKVQVLCDQAKALGLTPTQVFQANLTVLLSKMTQSSTVDAVLGAEMVDILKKSQELSPEKMYFQASNLHSRLVLFFGKKLRESGRFAAGSLLLGETSVYANPESKHLLYQMGHYDMLLNASNPAEFDEAIRIIQHPKDKLEQYIAERAFAYRFDYENTENTWDYETQVMKPNPNYKAPQYEVDKLLDLKSMHLMADGKYPEALEVLKGIPKYLWKRESQYTDYFKYNPFSVGLWPSGVDNPIKGKGQFSKITFLEKYLKLRADAEEDPKNRAANYFLLGNAEYNMAYPGRGWFLMSRPGKSGSELFSREEYDYGLLESGLNTSAPSSPDSDFPWPALAWLGVLTGFFLFRRPFGKLPLALFLLLSMVGMFCKSQNNPTNQKYGDSDSKARLDAYFGCSRAIEYYQKAISAAPNTEIAAAAYHCMLRCEKIAELYREEYKLEKGALDAAEWLKKAGKPTVSKQSTTTCAEFGLFATQQGWVK